MSEQVKKIRILGINRSSDDNIIEDGSCEHITNLEYFAGSYVVNNFVHIGRSNLSINMGTNFVKAWLHFINDTTINLIYLTKANIKECNKEYIYSANVGEYFSYNYTYFKCIKKVYEESVSFYNEEYFIIVENTPYTIYYYGRIKKINEKSTSDSYDNCFVFDGIYNKEIYSGIDLNEYNVSFVGNLLVINDVIYAARNKYEKGVSKKDIKVDIHFKRLDKGIGVYNKFMDADEIRTNTSQSIWKVTWFDDKTRMYTNHDSVKGFEAELLKLNKDCLKKGYFQGYAFLRYAIKLYDDSYINISPPVLVCSGINDDKHSRYFFVSESAKADIDSSLVETKINLYEENNVDTKDEQGIILDAKVGVEFDFCNIYLPKIERIESEDGRYLFTTIEGEYTENPIIVDFKSNNQDIFDFNYCKIQVNRFNTQRYNNLRPTSRFILTQDIENQTGGYSTEYKLLDEGGEYITLSNETDYIISSDYVTENEGFTIRVKLVIEDDEILSDGNTFEYPMSEYNGRKYIVISTHSNEALRSTIAQRGTRCKLYIKVEHSKPINVGLYNFQLEDLNGDFTEGINPSEYEFSRDFIIRKENKREYTIQITSSPVDVSRLRAISEYAYNNNRYNCLQLFVRHTTDGLTEYGTRKDDTNYFWNYNRFKRYKNPYTEEWEEIRSRNGDKINNSALKIVRHFLVGKDTRGSNQYNSEAFSVFRRNQLVSTFYTDNDKFTKERGYGVYLEDTYNNNKEIELTPENFHNLTGLPEEYCFYGCKTTSNALDSANAGNRPWGSVVALRKLSSIGMAIYENNISEFDKDLIAGVDVFMTLPVSIYTNECNKAAGDIVPAHRDCKSDNEIENEILSSLSSFYKIKSIEYNDFLRDNDNYIDILDGVDLSSEVFVSRDRLKDNTQILSEQTHEYQYVYNGMLHVTGIKGKINNIVKPLSYYLTEGEGFNNLSTTPITDVSTSSVIQYNNDLYRNISNNEISYKNISIDKYDDNVEKGIEGIVFLSASEQITQYAEFFNKNGEKNFCFKLKDLDGNVAGYYPPKFLGYIKSSDSSKYDYDYLEDGITYAKNILKVSKTESPLFYPDEQTYQVGKGKIIAVHSNSKELSQGQAGDAPIYVFTTEGIYALIVDKSGDKAYTYVDTINQDVLINKNIVCDTNYGLVYATEEGLKILQGKKSQSITDKLLANRKIDTYNPRLDAIVKNHKLINNYQTDEYGLDFISFLKDNRTKIEFISKSNCLVVYKESNDTYNGNSDYVYIINLKDGVITTQFLPVRTLIKGFPELYIFLNTKTMPLKNSSFSLIPDSTRIYRLKLSNEKTLNGVYDGMFNATNQSLLYTNNYSDVLIETRPIKLGGEHFKSTTRVILRGYFDNYYDYAYLYKNLVIDSDTFEGNSDSVYLKRKKQFYKDDEYGIARAFGLYVYGSNDCDKWELLGFTEKVNITCRDIGTTISHCSVKFIKLVFAGRLSNKSKIDYIEIQYDNKYTKKIR